MVIAQEDVAVTSNTTSCPVDLMTLCAAHDCCTNMSASTTTTTYNCSLPGLQGVLQPGLYEGLQVNYLSYVTATSSPNLVVRAKEFQACTGGRIVFSEATNIWEDPIRDLGTATARGSELYDGYFMSYSYFPEVSALGLAEHLNDRIRNSAVRLQWEDMLPAVQAMGEYRYTSKVDGSTTTNIDFLMYDGDFFVPIIRLDLLERHNLTLPNTWEEAVKYARFFNGTDLNDDGQPDYGFCHFPQLGSGMWDERWAEALYSTWATIDQTEGIQQGFFFDPDTMEPKFDSAEGFRIAASIWKELWTHGAEGCVTPNFITGRCAIGFAPPGCWKGVFLDPIGVARKDDNGTVIWQPTMKNGEYAEPYRFRPFGSLHVTDPKTGNLTKCTPKLCPKAERIPLSGHHGEQDRATLAGLPPSPIAGELINRVPFYWSGGLGTLIRKSAPPKKKDLMWDFFVYTNSPDTSVYDVANYASWLDSWRHSQLNSRDNFLQAGWSRSAYEEHVAVMKYALSGEGYGAFNIRLPSSQKYTRDAVGARMRKYIDGALSLDAMVVEMTNEWNDITDQAGRLEQLEIYRSSLGLDLHSEVQLCRLHRELMDERDPSVCRKYDEESTSTLAVIVPVVTLAALVVVGIGSYLYAQLQNKKGDLLWKVRTAELDFGTGKQVIGYGSFGVVLLAEYRGTKVAVKKVIPPQEPFEQEGGSEANGGKENDTEMGLRTIRPNHPIFGSRAGSVSRDSITSLKNTIRSNQASERKKLRAHFIREMRTLAKLRHPNITTTMGAVIEKGSDPMLVMEFMENGSLFEAIRNETLNLNSNDDILIIMQDIARGLRFLHSADVVHGDLKTKNVLIDSNLRAKVSDFGLSANTKDGARGTPYWMAPELLARTSSNTAMSDVYAFGILVYEVYSRKAPYEGEVYDDVINAVRDPAIRKRPPVPHSCPSTVSSLMLDCLQHDPQHRPSTKEVDSILQAEGTIQGRIVRIEALNKNLVEENKQISAEQAVQLGHFACMSHEIRTPLNCIIGVSSLLEHGDFDSSFRYKESVKMIADSSKLLKQIIDDVLDFSKFVSGNAEIDIQRIDLQETLMGIVRSMSMSPITERKQIGLQTLFDPRVPQYIDTDDRRLQQILYNLLSNAVKFSKDKSHVDLVVSVVDAPNMSHRLQLQVKDYGKGIQKADFDKVFQPFSQTESGTKSVDGGTGLGLAITKQLTELLGGSIIVDSEFSKWTTFTVQLPLTVSMVETKGFSKKLRKCCIWLVSDLSLENEVMERACKHFGVAYRHSKGMTQLEESMANTEQRHAWVCIVQENLLDIAVLKRITKRSKSVLITLGPLGTPNVGQMHYNSLTQKFPVVILQEICSIYEHGKLSQSREPISTATNIESQHHSYDDLKILIAEDNKINQKILLRILERLGVKKANLAVTDDGKEAVEAECKQSFDVVFLDIQMPVMDGLEACKLIVSRERLTPCPKVVFLSANLESDYKSISIANGATDYMSKPVGLVDLKNMLDKLMDNQT